jgi:hypothetical protein
MFTTEIHVIDDDIVALIEGTLSNSIPEAEYELFVLDIKYIVVEHSPQEIIVDPLVFTGVALQLFFGPGAFTRSLDSL